MRATWLFLTLCLASSTLLSTQSTGNSKIADYLKMLPVAVPPTCDEVRRIALAANPLGCEDHPHAAPMSRTSYLWQHEDKPLLLEDYDKHRAFYGCFDWHSAVNSDWMMVSVFKADPTIEVAPAIRNEFQNHFQKSTIDGELDYFKNLKGLGADFELPYGYAWLLKLYGEAKTWNDPEG